MRHLMSFNFSHIMVAIGLLTALAPAYARADTEVNCLQPPQEIINSVRGSDPVVSLQLAGKTLKTCGDTRFLDLQVDRKTLDIPFGVAKLEQLTGIWVSDMWLHVDKGITPPITELLSIKNAGIEQGLIRWYDPDDQKDPSYLSAYMPQIATARLQSTQDGVKITAFVASSLKGIHNPYVAMTGSEPNRHLKQMMTVVAIHLGKIISVRAYGDRLLLVDSRGSVRTYRRHSLDDVLASHKFFLAANINARTWPCVLGVLSRQLADKTTQDLTLIFVAQSLSIPSLQKAITKTNIDLKKLKPQSAKAVDLAKERDELSRKLRSLMDADFLKFTSQFDDPNQPPRYCIDK